MHIPSKLEKICKLAAAMAKLLSCRNGLASMPSRQDLTLTDQLSRFLEQVFHLALDHLSLRVDYQFSGYYDHVAWFNLCFYESERLPDNSANPISDNRFFAEFSSANNTALKRISGIPGHNHYHHSADIFLSIIAYLGKVTAETKAIIWFDSFFQVQRLSGSRLTYLMHTRTGVNFNVLSGNELGASFLTTTFENGTTIGGCHFASETKFAFTFDI